MSFVLHAVENVKDNWTISVSGTFADNSRSLYFKKVKHAGSLEKAIQNAIKVLRLQEEEFELTKVISLEEKKAEIESFRTPMGKIFKKIEPYCAEFNHDTQEISVLVDNSVHNNQYHKNLPEPPFHFTPHAINKSKMLTATLYQHNSGGLYVRIQAWDVKDENSKKEIEQYNSLLMDNMQVHLIQNKVHMPTIKLFAMNNRLEDLESICKELRNDNWKSL